MKRLPRTLVALLAWGLLVPLAQGGGSLDAGVAVVEVADRNGEGCATPAAGFCLVLVEGDGHPGSTTVDAYQRVDYVGVATDFGVFRATLGPIWLLPDMQMSQSASEIYLQNPVSPAVTTAWRDAPRPEETDRVVMDEEGVSATYVEPDWTAPGALAPREWRLEYSEEGSVGYDHVGPFHTMAGETGFSSDREYEDSTAAACQRGENGCGTTPSAALAAVPGLTPELRAGLEVYDVQLATDPANLTPSASRRADAAQAVNATVLAAAAEGSAEEEPSLEAFRAHPTSLEPAAQRDGPRPTGRAVKPEGPGVQVHTQPPRVPGDDIPVPLILGATAAGLLLVALGAGLYSRFHGRSDVLRSGTRDRLVELIRLNPGISMSDAAIAMGIARNAVQHHVRMLERVQVVRVQAERSRKALYLLQAPPTDAPPAWLLKNEACATIVRALQASPAGMRREEICDIVPDLPERTRNYNIQKLLAVGVVVQEETATGVKTLRAVRGSSPEIA